MSADQEKRILLRLGGLGGILAAILLVSFFVATFLDPYHRHGGSPESLAVLSMNRESYVITQSLLIVATLLIIPIFPALHRLRNSGYALLGGVFGVLGGAILFLGASGSTSSLGLSELYANAVGPDKMVVYTVAEGINNLLEAFGSAGAILMATAFIILGLDFQHQNNLPKVYGWMSVVFGILIVIGLSFGTYMGRPGLAILPLVFLSVIWLLVIGLKVYRMSKYLP